MDLEIGKGCTYRFAQTEVLDYEGIYTHLIKLRGVFKGLREVIVVHQGIQGDVGTYAP